MDKTYLALAVSSNKLACLAVQTVPCRLYKLEFLLPCLK